MLAVPCLRCGVRGICFVRFVCFVASLFLCEHRQATKGTKGHEKARKGRMHRFYVPSLGTENYLWIEGEEARHLARVVRVAVGEEVGVFDGSGVECTGVVQRAERDRVKIEILRRETVDRDPKLEVTLACAVVKPRAMELLIERCSELGLREFVPVETRRSVPKVERREEAHVERWERIAVEASKQCGRTTVTRIAPPRPLAAFLAKADRWDLRLAFSTDEDAAPLRKALSEHPQPRTLVYLIGPEGGLERTETREAEAAGFALVRMGKSTMRTETAAAAALAAILYHYES
jgi:16S rRNA (uracil1498-N3)-methyltransferase